MSNPKKWTEVYPYGTKEGDEEATFFKHLARHHKFDYRSVSQLVKSTGLSKERIEEIISKYAENYDPPLIYPHPTNDDHWGYWERCPDRVKDDYRGISRKDKDQRIDKQLNGASPTMTGNPSAVGNPITPSMTGQLQVGPNPCVSIEFTPFPLEEIQNVIANSIRSSSIFQWWWATSKPEEAVAQFR